MCYCNEQAKCTINMIIKYPFYVKRPDGTAQCKLFVDVLRRPMSHLRKGHLCLFWVLISSKKGHIRFHTINLFLARMISYACCTIETLLQLCRRVKSMRLLKNWANVQPVCYASAKLHKNAQTATHFWSIQNSWTHIKYFLQTRYLLVCINLIQLNYRQTLLIRLCI